MSLKDTIRGAREEAAENNLFDRDASQKGADKGTDGQVRAKGQGFARASAASGKPSREKSAGVRVVTADGRAKSKVEKAKMSKDERKEERKREREVEDRRYTLAQAVLKDNEEYNRLHKNWFRFLIAGVTFMVLALTFYGLVSQAGESAPAWLAIMALVTMVLAYVVVIAGMIYDWKKIKPIRDEVEKRTASMSDKRVRNALAKRAADQK